MLKIIGIMYRPSAKVIIRADNVNETAACIVAEKRASESYAQYPAMPWERKKLSVR